MKSEGKKHERGMGSYVRFAAMIATSTVVMFILMCLNTYMTNHICWSQDRARMALVIGAVMVIVMLAFMLSIDRNNQISIAIFASALAVFGLSL